MKRLHLKNTNYIQYDDVDRWPVRGGLWPRGSVEIRIGLLSRIPKVGGDTPRLAECVLRFILRGEDVGATPMRLSLKPPGDRLARRRRSLAGVLAQ